MKFTLFFSLFFIISTISAQVNIEKHNNLNSMKGLMGNLSIYVSSKTGNTDIQQIEIDGRLNYKGDSFYTLLITQGEYGWNQGVEFSNNALLHFRYLKDLNNTFKSETFGQINYNKSRLLLFRSLAGTGFRIGVISDSLNSLDFGSSYMYEYEELDLNETSIHSKETFHHRWNNYVSFSSSLTSNTRLSIVVYAQPRLDDFNDIRLLSENNLGVALTHKLSLSLNLSLRYDSKPPDRVKELDTNTKVGFTIKF